MESKYFTTYVCKCMHAMYDMHDPNPGTYDPNIVAHDPNIGAHDPNTGSSVE